MFGLIDPYSIELQNCIFCFVIATVSILTILFIACKVSGLPFRSPEAAGFMKTIN